MNWFSRTFKMDRARAAQENEALFTPLKWGNRRKSFNMYCTAFGWGFLMTGLAAGAQLVGLTWSDALKAIIIGNLVLVIIAGICAIPGQQTGMGNSPVFMFTFGKYGFYLPALILTVCVIGWQGANIGMVTSVWTGGLTTGTVYVIISIIVGIIGLLMTYFGIGLIEKFAIVATVILVIIGAFSLYYCIDGAGGYAEFVKLADKAAADAEVQQTLMQGITKVIGAWIAGSIICTELTRFAKTPFVASSMMVIGIPLCQIFLNLIGYCGQVTYGTFDFTAYLGQIGFFVYIIALISMTFALFSSLDTNLYFPSALTSFMINVPRKGGVVICGVLGIFVAIFELFAHYGSFLNVLGAILPALAGPVIAEYFIINKGKWDPKLIHKVPKVNWAAIIGYIFGIAMQYLTCPPMIPREIWALVFAILGTVVLNYIFRAAKYPQGYILRKDQEVEPLTSQPDDSNLGDYEKNFINYD